VLIVDRDEAELGAVASSIGGDAIAAQWARERSNVIESDGSAMTVLTALPRRRGFCFCLAL
jgi:hypothetical protein